MSNPTRSFSRFIRACLKGETTSLYNRGRDVTDFHHIQNLCHVLDLCLSNVEAIGHAFEVGTGRSVSVIELAELIKTLTDSTSELQLLPPRVLEESKPQISIPSIRKLPTILNFKPQLSLENCLLKTMNYIKISRHPAGLQTFYH